ncbi:MAG: hypothetical protein P8M70_13920 [Verrucomicrobiota bacterium]|nr:hypothetical protein [Verrucomicrobiota bacterium]
MSDQDSHNSEQQSYNIESQLSRIEELENKLKLIRWGLFAGVLAVMAIGISSIWKTTKRAAEPAVEVYKEAKVTYEGIQGKIDNLETHYGRISPKAKKAYKTVSSLMSREENSTSSQLREDFEKEYEERIKPAAEDLAKKVLVDIQGQAAEKFSELSTHADDIMGSATKELHTLTNSIPEKIKFAINETLVKTINEREAKMRKMFPKLTKEKQSAVLGRLSELSEEQGEKIFLTLFADHISELGKVSDSLQKIQQAEAGGTQQADGQVGDIQTSLTLLSAILEVAQKEFETEGNVSVSNDDQKEDPKKEVKKKQSSENPPAKDDSSGTN